MPFIRTLTRLNHLDGFGNKVTNYAAANPEKKPAGNLLNTRAAGFGVVRLNTKTRQITMECWPRNVDVTDPSARQYPGWPRTISQFDNYNPPSWGKLGELTFDVDSPVVQLVDSDSGEVLYTVRVNGKSFVPGAPQGKTFQLLRLSLDPALGVIPEISGNRLMVSIRFMRQEADNRLHAISEDCAFELSLCS